ncbi:MAG: hypothetical protein FD167_1155, partial [bacterium]
QDLSFFWPLLIFFYSIAFFTLNLNHFLHPFTVYEFLMGEKEGLKEQFFPTLSTLVSVIQMALQLYYVLYLYQVFF